MKTDCQMSFRTTEEFKQRLEAAAAQEKRPVANLVKLILESWLDQYENARRGGEPKD